MGRAVGSIDNLIQGVSEQAPRDRLDGQLEAQLNMTSYPVEGAARRQGAKLIKQLATYPADAFYYTYKRDTDENFTIVIWSGGVDVLDKDGIEQSVIFTMQEATAMAYLNGKLTATSVGDTTIVANTEKLLAMTTDVSDPIVPQSGGKQLIWFTGVEYGRTYKLYADTVLLSEYTTPSSITVPAGDTQTALTLDPTVAMDSIRSGWTPAATAAGWTLSETYAHGVAVLSSTKTVTDMYTEGGSEFKVLSNHEIKTVRDLPPTFLKDMIIRVANSENVKEDDYYLQYDVPSGITAVATDSGTWRECAGDAVLTTFDSTTMPIVIKQKTAGGAFYVEYPNDNLGWDLREVGDDKTNKIPTFIGKSINKIGTFQNRLFFLAGTSWVLTRTEDYWNFWNHTALTKRDDDRIDVLAPSTSVNDLDGWAMYNRNLIIFSEGTQYIQSGTTPLTRQTANLGVSTNYVMDLTCAPESTGDAILFCTKSGDSTQVNAFRLEDDSNLERATKLTAHVPKYLPNGIEQIVSSSALNIAILRDGTDTLYIYQWHLEGNQWLQQAWHKWEISGGNTVEHMVIDDKILKLTVKNTATGTCYLLALDLTSQQLVDYAETMHIDMWQKIETAQWTQDGAVYWCDLPIDLPDTDLVFIAESTATTPRMLLPIQYNFSSLRYETSFFNDIGVQESYVGRYYESSFKPTPPYMKDSEGNAVSDNYIELEDLVFNVVNSGEVLAVLEYEYRDALEIPLNQVTVGGIPIGTWYVTTKAFNLPVYCNNVDLDITIKAVTHMPMRVTDMGWQGMYKQLGRWV